MKSAHSRMAACALAALLLAACGGGGGGGSSAPASSSTKFVTGAIAGFGSVIVNGVHYESDSATVTIDGHPGTVDQLKVGQVVHMKTVTDAQGKSHATSIDEDRLAQGVVEAVDVAAGTLKVAGLIIKVDDATSFDQSIPGGTLAGIGIGDRVEVHGFVSAAGDALATRIEMADAGDREIEVTGPVTALDTGAKRFTVGTQVVDYSVATLRGFAASDPALGDIVEAQGTTLLPDGALQAAEVQKEDGRMEGDKGDEGELDGLVTSVNLPTDFEVSGQKIMIAASTTFVGGTSADLKVDTRVEVEGHLDAGGELVADKVILKHESSVKLSAPVEVDVTLDPADPTGGTGTLRVLGLTFIVTPDTRKEDDETDKHFFSLADVHVGDWVELSGYPDPAGSGKLIATRLEKHGSEDEVELKGLADQLAAPTFKILGVGVATTDSTKFSNEETPITSAEFFSTASGQRVEVEGSWDGTTLIATQAQIDAQN